MNLELEALFYAKALRDIRRLPRSKRKKIKRLSRRLVNVRSVLSLVLPKHDASVAKAFLDRDTLFDHVFSSANEDEHGMEQFRVGDLVACGQEGSLAEVRGLVPATGKVMVAWLVEFEDEACVDPSCCVDLRTGERVRWHGHMLSNVVQPAHAAFHWEHVRPIDVDVPPQRYMAGLGIVESHPGHDFDHLEDLLLASPPEVLDLLRGTGLGKRWAALKDALRGGGFSAEHRALASVLQELPAFDERDPVQGTCVWCNGSKTLTYGHDRIGMGTACFEKYQHFRILEQLVRGLRDRFPGPFGDSDVGEILRALDDAQKLVANDADASPVRRRIRRSRV